MISPPPSDIDAERAVLSAVVLDPPRITQIDDVLLPADFFDERHRIIAGAVWDLEARGERIDVMTVAALLRGAGRLDAAGGSPYLAELTDATPSIVNVRQHAEIVAACATVRRMIALAKLVAAEGYGARNDVPGWVESVEQRVLEVTDRTARMRETASVVKDLVGPAYDQIRERKEETASRETGLRPLDRILRRLVDGVPYVVAGRPGHGKTALAWQVAEHVALNGELVIFLSQEMPRDQLIMRAIAQRSGIEVDRLLSGKLTPSQWDNVAIAVGAIEGLPISVDERSGLVEHTARAAIRRGVHRLRALGHQGRLGLVVIDHLQLMGKVGRDLYTSTTENMHGVQRIAKDIGAPVMVLSQLNREIEKRTNKRPQLSDLNDSGAVEADAYSVIFTYREDCYRPQHERDGTAEIIVAKHRNGRTGTIRMGFTPATRLVEIVGEPDFDEFDNFDPGGTA